MKHLINFFKGMIIGIANIIPGVSGGTIAITMGIYEKLINTIGNFFTDFFKNLKNNLTFLIPVGLGAVVGILTLSRFLEYLLENYVMPTKFAFIGLILGGIPLIFKSSNAKGFKKSYLVPGIITLLIGVSLTILQNLGLTGIEIVELNLNLGNILILFTIGVIAATSMVIPGISGSFMLVLLGYYTFILSSVNTFNIPILIPFGLGVVVGVLFCAKLIDFLLNRFYGYTYYGILGFVLGSIPAIYPGFSFNILGIVSIIVLLLGFAFSYFFDKVTNK